MNLTQVANQTEAHKSIVKALGAKVRHRHVTNLYNMKKALPTMDDAAFLSVFRDFEKAGLGSLIIGRKNNPNRFVWNYHLKDVREAMRSGKALSTLSPLPHAGKKLQIRRRKRRGDAELIKAMPVKQPAAEFSPWTPRKKKEEVPMISINIQLPANTSKKELTAFLELASGLASVNNK